MKKCYLICYMNNLKIHYCIVSSDDVESAKEKALDLGVNQVVWAKELDAYYLG